MQPLVILLGLAATPVLGGWLPGKHSGEHGAQYGGDRSPEIVRLGHSRVRGVVDGRYSSVRQFLGIPYAEPPVGELRWEKPRKNRLPRVVNATAYGRSCSQFAPTQPNVITADLPEYNIADINATGEDCLTLSIWTPRRAKKLPVLVFFYGGGWYSGGQNTPYLIPTQWVQRTKDLIVVIPNTRGNIFGFSNAEGADELNPGLLDQRLVVEWVRDNIAAFGGDPRKITIWGQSSGAEAVDIYNYAWYEDPIVHGLIMTSGTALIEPILEPGLAPRYSNFSYIAARVGCGGAADPKEEFACMKKLDGIVLETALADVYNSPNPPILSFGPSVDNKMTFYDYAERSRLGKQTKLPAIIGTTRDEGTLFTPYDPNGIDTALAEFYTQLFFTCTAFQTSKLRAGADIPTYRYLYAGNFSNVSPRPWLGAYHGSELPLLFGTHGNYRGRSTKQEVAVSEALQDAWRAFADDPVDGLAAEEWPRYTPQGDVVRVFGEGDAVAENVVGRLKASEDQC